jgi:arylsulfatase A-like enzyme
MRWPWAGASLGLLVGIGALAWWMGSSSDPELDDDPAERRRLLSIVEGPTASSAPAPGSPNVVLVIGCTFRRDQTSVYNAALPDTTPFLASLARQGVVLDDLVNAAPWTKAASTAIVTGHHAVQLGMVEDSSQRNAKVLPDEVVTVAEAFRDAGYRTFGLTTNPNVHSRMGFAQGFERYAEPAHLWREHMAKAPGRVAVHQALEWVEQADDRPFYLQVLLVDAHAPFPREGLPTDPEVPELVGRYRAGLVKLDRHIERLVQGLRDAGHGDDTYVVVVNDHGEGLEWPAHHGKGHGRYLAPSAVGGIGVFHGPDLPAGRRVPGLASQVDLAPTLLGLAGIDGWSGPGYDLAPALRGTDRSTPRTEAYADTWFRKSQRTARFTEDRVCQVNFVRSDVVDRHGHRFEQGCFDRRTDPDHARPERDPAGERAVVDWRSSMLAEAARRGEVRSAEIDDDMDRQLEALGYVEGDDEP